MFYEGLQVYKFLWQTPDTNLNSIWDSCTYRIEFRNTWTMRAARMGYLRLLKSHKVQKYVRLDRKTRQQMEIVWLWLLLLLWACTGYRQSGQWNWGIASGRLCGAPNWCRRQNCVACGSTQNTKVINVIAKCDGANKQYFQMWKKLKRKRKTK